MGVVLQQRGRLHDAIRRVCEEMSHKQVQHYPWQDHDEYELWYELASCILGSGVPYEQAIAAARHLHIRGLLDFRPQGCNLAEFEMRIAQALSQPIFPTNRESGEQRYLFPFRRANYIRRTVESIYTSGSSLSEILSCSRSAADARVRIVSRAVGVGPKQASLFLREIGYADELAILDRHVLQYMAWTGLTPCSAAEVRTLRGYERAEAVFRTHAQQMGFSVAHLDLAVWVVVRVLRRGFYP